MVFRFGVAARPVLLALVAAAVCACTSPAALAREGRALTQASPQDVKFAEFVRDFRDTAYGAGIRHATYDAAMAHVTRKQSIEDLNLFQPEFTLPVWVYLDRAVSDRRITDGEQALTANTRMLAGIETKYGVPKEFLVSIWGNESDYGRGGEPFNMFDALATLAYDGPRMDYARRELISALKMMQQQNFSPERMTSSWAGAFGQTQFVPSTFLAHAVDGDGDSVIDLWRSSADALASAAAVLADAGWQRGAVWGYEIQLPKDFPYEQADIDTVKPVAEWRRLGVKTAGGAALPASPENGAVYLPAGTRGPAFLVSDNFKVILKYNNAASYALAVCTLAERIKGGAPIQASWPRDEHPLNRDERIAFQTGLAKLGYDIGTIDGVLGRKARAATRDFQLKHAMPADGFPTEDLLTRIAIEAQAKGR